MIMTGKTTKSCCMCGDIGFTKDLILCSNCGFRLQHTYCSRSYPGIEMKTWRCEWCVYEQEKRETSTSPREGCGLAGKEPDQPVLKQSKEEKKPRRKRDNDDGRPTPATGVASPRSKKQKAGGDRWRKLNCNSSSRVIGRRYKLLADVLC